MGLKFTKLRHFSLEAQVSHPLEKANVTVTSMDLYQKNTETPQVPLPEKSTGNFGREVRGFSTSNRNVRAALQHFLSLRIPSGWVFNKVGAPSPVISRVETTPFLGVK